MKPKIKIEDIKPLKDGYAVPEGYFDSLADRIDAKKGKIPSFIKVEDIYPVEESFVVPDGYFEGLMASIEERKAEEDNVVSFRRRRIRIWGSFVAAACIAMVVVSVVNFGSEPEFKFVDGGHRGLDINIPDQEMAFLLEDRDDEFALTEEEIIDAIVYESKESESTAIIDFLQDEGDLDGVPEDEDFLDEI